MPLFYKELAGWRSLDSLHPVSAGTVLSESLSAQPLTRHHTGPCSRNGGNRVRKSTLTLRCHQSWPRWLLRQSSTAGSWWRWCPWCHSGRSTRCLWWFPSLPSDGEARRETWSQLFEKTKSLDVKNIFKQFPLRILFSPLEHAHSKNRRQELVPGHTGILPS